jgi:16S rRNA (guanine966-N2)-methyltransferase
MSDKMRGALFNMLGDIEGLTVFDAFGGSGALSFEAISRGAKSAVITEVDKYAWAVIKQNVEKLKVDTLVKVIRVNTSEWSKNNYETKFDLVICDPPYDKIKIDQLQTLTNNVKNGGMLILSLPSKIIAPIFDAFELLRSSNYGDGSLAFYRKIKA